MIAPVALFKIFIYLFIFGCVGSSLLHAGFSLVATSGALFFAAVHGLLIAVLLLLQSMRFRRTGVSNCGTQALERRLSSCGARA